MLPREGIISSAPTDGGGLDGEDAEVVGELRCDDDAPRTQPDLTQTHVRVLDSQGLSQWQPPGPEELARIEAAETQPGEPSEFTRSRSGRRDSQGGNRQVEPWTSTQRDCFEQQLQMVTMANEDDLGGLAARARKRSCYRTCTPRAELCETAAPTGGAGPSEQTDAADGSHDAREGPDSARERSPNSRHEGSTQGQGGEI